jgi:hypothetical protein
MDAASLPAALSFSLGSVSLRPGGRPAAAVSFRPFASSFLSDDVASLSINGNNALAFVNKGALSESLAQNSAVVVAVAEVSGFVTREMVCSDFTSSGRNRLMSLWKPVCPGYVQGRRSPSGG